MAPTLEIIIGPMFSGKSTELLRRLNIYATMKLNVLYVNSSFDDRATTMWSTHNPTMKSIGNIAATKVQNLSELNEEITCVRGEESLKAHLSSFDVIGIDEAQFFSVLLDLPLRTSWAKKSMFTFLPPSNLSSSFLCIKAIMVNVTAIPKPTRGISQLARSVKNDNTTVISTHI
ncbi:unnamed protein product [marine sediment metagenome]|uniref:thymidine kinase n=1 Tax=marine sediment metagenome TaxID=412755 RepID=X0Z3N5_9ZZZZ